VSEHPAPTSRPSLGRRARSLAGERLGLKALSLLFAVLLWLVVAARQPTETFVRVRLDPVLDSSLVMLDGTTEVQALVMGRAADLVKLYATPPVLRRSVSGDAPDTLMLDITPTDVRVPAELADAVHVVDVQPRSVMLRFETRATRRVAVVNDGRVQVRGDSGAASAPEVEFEPKTVRITGPRRLVRGLREVRPFSLSIAPNDTMQHVADLDTTGSGVRVQPSQVRVRVRPLLVSAPSASATP